METRLAVRSILTKLLLPCCCFFLTACDPFTLTAVGVGATAGVQHTLSGIVYRTFSAPLPKVRQAVLDALKQMEIKVKKHNLIWTGEEILATAADRQISIELEVITPKTTRIKVITHAMIMDSATSMEIVSQTEKALALIERNAAQRPAPEPATDGTLH